MDFDLHSDHGECRLPGRVQRDERVHVRVSPTATASSRASRKRPECGPRSSCQQPRAVLRGFAAVGMLPDSRATILEAHCRDDAGQCRSSATVAIAAATVDVVHVGVARSAGDMARHASIIAGEFTPRPSGRRGGRRGSSSASRAGVLGAGKPFDAVVGGSTSWAVSPTYTRVPTWQRTRQASSSSSASLRVSPRW